VNTKLDTLQAQNQEIHTELQTVHTKLETVETELRDVKRGWKSQRSGTTSGSVWLMQNGKRPTTAHVSSSRGTLL
jgi:hypothetical protein